MLIVWVIFLVLFLLILGALAVVFNGIFVIKSNYGNYTPVVNTPCSVLCPVNSNQESASGTALAIQQCIPNSETGLGCLINGRQTFLPIVTAIPCTTVCASAMWETIDVKQCAFYTNPLANPFITPGFTGCVVAGGDGLAAISAYRRRCVLGPNPNGPNLCQTTTGGIAPVGTIETVISSCQPTGPTGPLNPQCGTFGGCQGNLPFTIDPTVMNGGTSPFNLFHEGVTITGLPCNYLTNLGMPQQIFPPLTGPPTVFCLPNIGNCRTMAPTAQEVVTRTISNPQIQTICSANPSCFGVGRAYPAIASSGNTILDALLNRPFYVNTVSGFAAPTSRPNLSRPNVSLVITNPNVGMCSVGQVLLVNGLVWWFCPDFIINSNTYAGRFMSLIDSGSFGWLTGTGQYSSVQPSYLTIDGNSVSAGANWLNATQFTLTISSTTSPTIPIPTGFPVGTSGWTASISGFSIGGMPLSNVSLYLLPVLTDPTFNVYPLNTRGSQNGCNIII